MKLKSISIQNFRGYKDEVKLDFSAITAIIGKNDIGKSTIMEALDIFFHDGKGLIKLDKADINVENARNGNLDVCIGATFVDLPSAIVIDGTNETSLEEEFLLNASNELEVIKTFKNGDTKVSSIKVCLKANHPTNPHCSSLLQKKNDGLKKIVEDLDLHCNKSINAEMRKAIWDHYSENLQCGEILIDVSSKDGDIKSIWEKLQEYLPEFSLFQSDRKNSDGDDEVQDPLKEAVKQILKDENIQRSLSEVAQKVQEKVQQVADLTLEKLREMSPEISNSLHPNIPSVASLKWADVFKGLSISGDGDIAINKRGSGVKRLILLNFFRAEAERRMSESQRTDILYAIEEPETSQHKDHQIMLIDALKRLSANSHTQVIITTHSSDIVKNMDSQNIRLIGRNEEGKPIVKEYEPYCLPYASLNEANCRAFDDYSAEFHNELYGFLQEKAASSDNRYWGANAFESWLEANGCDKIKTWIKVDRNGRTVFDCTLQTYVRNIIHHPENTLNVNYTRDELKASICKMMEIARTLP